MANPTIGAASGQTGPAADSSFVAERARSAATAMFLHHLDRINPYAGYQGWRTGVVRFSLNERLISPSEDPDGH